MMNGTTNVSRDEVLVFQIEGRRFGLRIGAVEEIVRSVSQTPLGAGTTSFEGVIDLRGSLVPVLDLRGRLGMRPKVVGLSDHLIITRATDRRVAVRVDHALELTQLDCSSREEVHAIGGRDDWIEGLAKHPGYGVIPVLSMSALLRDRDRRPAAIPLDVEESRPAIGGPP